MMIINWIIGWIALAIFLFIILRNKIRGYFFKVKKTGEKLKFKEFMKRWKKGIEGITSLQQTRTTIMGTWIVITGQIAGIIINVLTRIKGQWLWITIVLIGSLIIVSMSMIGTLQKYWRLKEIDKQMKGLKK